MGGVRPWRSTNVQATESAWLACPVYIGPVSASVGLGAKGAPEAMEGAQSEPRNDEAGNGLGGAICQDLQGILENRLRLCGSALDSFFRHSLPENDPFRPFLHDLEARWRTGRLKAAPQRCPKQRRNRHQRLEEGSFFAHCRYFSRPGASRSTGSAGWLDHKLLNGQGGSRNLFRSLRAITAAET